MKLLFVLTQSLDSPSGLGRFGPLARELVRRGHQVEVVALHPDWNRLPARRLIEEGVTVEYVSQMHVQKEGSHKRYFSPGRLLWISLLAVIRLTRAVWSSEAEIIQLCKPQPLNALAVRLARRGRPVFCDADDYEAESNRLSGGWQKQVIRFFEDGVIRYAAGITTNTTFTAGRFRALGYPDEKIIIVPNGIESGRFEGAPETENLRRQLGIPAEAPVVVYIGTLGLLTHPVDLLLEAFALVLREKPEARLLLAGGGEDFEALRRMAGELGIDGRTIFAGRVPPDQVPRYFALGDVSVDPVHDDLIARARSPLKLVESLAAGTPVVTADVGDRAAMLLDSQLGRIVAPGRAEALTDGILTVLDEGKSAERRAALRRAAAAWDWAVLAGRFLQFYEQLHQAG